MCLKMSLEMCLEMCLQMSLDMVAICGLVFGTSFMVAANELKTINQQTILQ